MGVRTDEKFTMDELRDAMQVIDERMGDIICRPDFEEAVGGPRKVEAVSFLLNCMDRVLFGDDR